MDTKASKLKETRLRITELENDIKAQDKLIEVLEEQLFLCHEKKTESEVMLETEKEKMRKLKEELKRKSLSESSLLVRTSENNANNGNNRNNDSSDMSNRSFMELDEIAEGGAELSAWLARPVKPRSKSAPSKSGKNINSTNYPQEGQHPQRPLPRPLPAAGDDHSKAVVQHNEIEGRENNVALVVAANDAPNENVEVENAAPPVRGRNRRAARGRNNGQEFKKRSGLRSSPKNGQRGN